MPDGPLLLVANHNNMLIDPLLVLWAVRREVRPIVKSPHFNTPVFSWVLERIGALPVYRPQDDASRLARNRTTLQAVSAALKQGDALLVFPEGGSEAGPQLRPLKAGAARAALTAEAEAGWRLGLQIVPLGLALECPRRFRSRAVVAIGPAIEVTEMQRAFESEPARASPELTGQVRIGIETALHEAHFHLEAASAREAAERPSRLGQVGWIAGLPLAALGTVAWSLPAAAAWIAPVVGRTEPTTISTIKLLTAIVAFPVAYGLWLLGALMAGGAFALVVAAAVLPGLGFYAIAWHDRRRSLAARKRRRPQNTVRTRAVG